VAATDKSVNKKRSAASRRRSPTDAPDHPASGTGEAAADGTASVPAPARRPPGRPSSRERILKAAEGVVAECGALHLSLDAVAERAGVSKGGLLYNFPSKEILLKALVARHLLDLDVRRADAAGSLAGGPNAAARAHLVAKMAAYEPPPSGVLAALAENPSLLDPLRAHHAAFVDRLRVAEDPVLCLIAFLAVEGLKSLDIFEANPLTAEERKAICERLMSVLASPRRDEPA
jgi:AcrR family transcriptional regulator